MISIALIDDNQLVREGITALLNQLPGLRVIASGSEGNLALLHGLNPDVVLLDLGLQHADSLRLAVRLQKECPPCKVIVMDLLPAQEDLVDFVNAGVAGFVMKDATLEEFASTIRTVAAGGHVLPPMMTGSLFSRIARDAVARGRPEELASARMTPREREVIDLIAEGSSNKEIADRLSIAEHTVRSHVRNVMEKLALHTRLQIAAYANRGDPM